MRTLNNEMWGRMQPDTVVAQRYHRLRLPNMVAMGTRMSKDVELVKKHVKKR